MTQTPAAEVKHLPTGTTLQQALEEAWTLPQGQVVTTLQDGQARYAIYSWPPAPEQETWADRNIEAERLQDYFEDMESYEAALAQEHEASCIFRVFHSYTCIGGGGAAIAVCETKTLPEAKAWVADTYYLADEVDPQGYAACFRYGMWEQGWVWVEQKEQTR